MMAAASTCEFSTTPGGSIATGKRRLAVLFGTLEVLMILACLAAWFWGRVAPGMLALGAALLVGFTWRMSHDLRPRRLFLEPGVLKIATPRHLIEVDIEGAQIRRLADDEIAHLERLASAGGVVAGSGGYDSRHLGEFDLYASDLRHAVFIRGMGGRMIVTPDEPVKFVAKFQQMASSPLLQSTPHE